MDKASGLCIFFLLAMARACEHSPGISITSLRLEGLSGSCLLIPCVFTVNASGFRAQDSSAVWIRTQSQFKNPHSSYVAFNSSRPGQTNLPMEIIGNTNERNCTTLFNNLKTAYTTIYFFRVEDGGFKSTASCDPIYITVRDSPWSPSIEVSGEQNEAEVVDITCSALTPCLRDPPKLTWDLPQGTANQVRNSDGTFNTSITYRLSLTLSHNGHAISCSATYPGPGNTALGTAATTITLNVTRKAGDVTVWLPVIAAIVVIALIGGVVYVCCVKFRRPNLQPAKSQITVESAQKEQDQNEDGLHYGDFVFNQRNAKPVNRAQEETLYSQVQVSNNSNRKATEMTEIYAQVKK